eukprot:GHVU01138495.1.p2 GENE.GHVU01138495.1~~GHVU01138495.1.p2  ORF type:complete len:108 (+),score=3.00 GHVU01138495.1:586-909(+)
MCGAGRLRPVTASVARGSPTFGSTVHGPHADEPSSCCTPPSGTTPYLGEPSQDSNETFDSHENPPQEALPPAPSVSVGRNPGRLSSTSTAANTPGARSRCCSRFTTN